MKSRSKYVAMMALALTMVSCGDSDKDEPAPVPPVEPTMTSTRLNVTVLDYSPAPGQFVNEIPEYEAGDTYELMNRKATESLCNGDMISLGAWGGSVTIKLPQSIPNVEGKADFRVVGNAVYANDASNAIRIGSPEPGIVMVMRDENGNGLPDDIWYELCGNQHVNAIANYQVTYHRPTADATDNQYIAWSATNGDNGYINRTIEHQQDYFPMWLDEVETMTFTGRRLPDNGVFNTETNKFDLSCYDGYADSHPNNVEASCLDIDNAVNSAGVKVSLASIDFIKVYTGVLQANGPLGECSTEVAAIEQITYK